MATKFEIIQGKVKWMKHEHPNQWDKYSHDIYLNADSLEKFKTWQKSEGNVQGIKNTLKKDDDGYYVSISRPKTIRRGGRDELMNPPFVFNSDGTTPFHGLVGNGSDITTKVELYTFNVPMMEGKKARAVRWYSSKVDHLVPYEGKRDNTPEFDEPSRGLPEAPVQAGAW